MRMAVATGKAAASLRARADALPDVVAPQGFADVRPAITTMREALCLALDTLADRSQGLETRMNMSLANFSDVDEWVAGQLSQITRDLS